jgi:hypothetical protein
MKREHRSGTEDPVSLSRGIHAGAPIGRSRVLFSNDSGDRRPSTAWSVRHEDHGCPWTSVRGTGGVSLRLRRAAFSRLKSAGTLGWGLRRLGSSHMTIRCGDSDDSDRPTRESWVPVDFSPRNGWRQPSPPTVGIARHNGPRALFAFAGPHRLCSDARVVLVAGGLPWSIGLAMATIAVCPIAAALGMRASGAARGGYPAKPAIGAERDPA